MDPARPPARQMARDVRRWEAQQSHKPHTPVPQISNKREPPPRPLQALLRLRARVELHHYVCRGPHSRGQRQQGDDHPQRSGEGGEGGEGGAHTLGERSARADKQTPTQTVTQTQTQKQKSRNTLSGHNHHLEDRASLPGTQVADSQGREGLADCNCTRRA